MYNQQNPQVFCWLEERPSGSSGAAVLFLAVPTSSPRDRGPDVPRCLVCWNWEPPPENLSALLSAPASGSPSCPPSPLGILWLWDGFILPAACRCPPCLCGVARVVAITSAGRRDRTSSHWELNPSSHSSLQLHWTAWCETTPPGHHLGKYGLISPSC